MNSLLLEPLDLIETHLNSLVTSLTQTNTFVNAPQIAKDLVTDDDNLSTSLSLLQRHQQNYAHIVDLRAEVEELQSQLKDTIRRCVAFRQEIVQVHPSILEGSDDEDEDEEEGTDDSDNNVSEIDYHTLLAFAARIGKHNAAAAREAEAEAVRRKIAAKKATATVNGVREGDTEGATQETEAELERINNTVAQTRAQMGMAFPDANLLRVGALGRLQYFQEKQAGAGADVQEAIDREVERLVRESEDVAEAAAEEPEQPTVEDGAWSGLEMPNRSFESSGQPGQRPREPSGLQQVPRQSGGAPSSQPKKKVDLDFPSSDEEDDG